MVCMTPSSQRVCELKACGGRGREESSVLRRLLEEEGERTDRGERQRSRRAGGNLGCTQRRGADRSGYVRPGRASRVIEESRSSSEGRVGPPLGWRCKGCRQPPHSDRAPFRVWLAVLQEISLALSQQPIACWLWRGAKAASRRRHTDPCVTTTRGKVHIISSR